MRFPACLRFFVRPSLTPPHFSSLPFLSTPCNSPTCSFGLYITISPKVSSVCSILFAPRYVRFLTGEAPPFPPPSFRRLDRILSTYFCVSFRRLGAFLVVQSLELFSSKPCLTFLPRQAMGMLFGAGSPIDFFLFRLVGFLGPLYTTFFFVQ